LLGLEIGQGSPQFVVERDRPTTPLALGRDIAQLQRVADRAVRGQHHGPGRRGDFLRPQARLERQQDQDPITLWTAVFSATSVSAFASGGPLKFSLVCRCHPA
jgi:hypothetical protein